MSVAVVLGTSGTARVVPALVKLADDIADQVVLAIFDANLDASVLATLRMQPVDECIVLESCGGAAQFDADLLGTALDRAGADWLLVGLGAEGLPIGAAVASRRCWAIATGVTGAERRRDTVVVTAHHDHRNEVARYELTEGSVLVVHSVLGDAAGEAGVNHRPMPARAAGDVRDADVVIALGRGVSSRALVDRFAAVAERLGASLAASRPIVDAGWATPRQLVGQSGRTVSPSVYVTFGISGAAPHLGGMRGADVVIAVNRDPGATIFGHADYGVVGDVVATLEALERELNLEGGQ